MMKNLIGFVLAAAFTATGATYASAANISATDVTDAVKQESNKLYSIVSSYMGTSSANYNNSSTASNTDGNAAAQNNSGRYNFGFDLGQWLKYFNIQANKPATTPKPTATPTPQPTTQPTPTQTPQETQSPTTQPTPQPSTIPAPTAVPTPKPTVKPTPQPSTQPTPQPTQSGSQKLGTNYKALQDKIFELTNVERKKNGLAPFVYNATVERYAVAKSQDMAINNYFDHNSPTNGYFYDIWKRDGYKYSAGAENLYYMSNGTGYANQDINTLAQQIVTGWMNSSGHRANILNPNLKELGVGVAEKGGKLYATQIFHTN